MDEIQMETNKGETNPTFYVKNDSIFFNSQKISGKYYEIIEGKKAQIIFGDSDELVKKEEANKTINDNLEKYDEITFICDFNNLAETLEVSKLENVINKFITLKNEKNYETEFSLIIQNCLLADKGDNEIRPLFSDVADIHLNFKKLEISDELYSFSPYIKTLFFKFRVEELVLKKFKFNSKAQLIDLCNFIGITSCKKLTLDDFFIELIIKKDEKDEEYNDLDIYFKIVDGNIILNHVYTEIKSLTLRDCPLFAIIGDVLFSNNLEKLTVDVDQNSLLNPSIITKFKIEKGKFDICFDLDSLKIKLEEEEDKELNEKSKDYLYFLKYIFTILSPNWEKKENQKILEDVPDSGIKNIDKTKFHKLVFKNFDVTKYEYITGEDVTYIDEENWVLNEEEKKRKADFENLVSKIENANQVNISELNEVVFDNCSNLFIRLTIDFLKGKNTNYGPEYAFDLLKLKKCSKDYVDLSKILKMKIKNLILFDTPLIIGAKFPEKGKKHFDLIEEKGRLGTVDNLTIKLNSLDCYAREYNLNVMKTYEILIEIMESDNFNKHLTFELNALPNIMTYLCYIKYVKNQNKYNNQNDDEDGKDEIPQDAPKGEQTLNIFEEDVNYLPKYFFISSKKYRDLLCSESFKLNWKFIKPITIKNTTIKKCYENYENQSYILYKIQENSKNNNMVNKMYTTNKELRKMDFGSDGFYIERDYKYFFFENNIKEVILDNVTFSNFRDASIEKKNRDYETINNLIGSNNFGGSLDKYDKMIYPNYTMDMRTFNGIFCINYGYDNVLGFFRRLIYDNFDKPEEKDEISADIKGIFQTFSKFKINNISLTIIIKSIEEQKEFYCLITILDFIISKGVLNSKKEKSKENINYLEKKLQGYFNKEKNENEEYKYSDFNYYYYSAEEEIMVADKNYKVGDYVINIRIEY